MTAGSICGGRLGAMIMMTCRPWQNVKVKGSLLIFGLNRFGLSIMGRGWRISIISGGAVKNKIKKGPVVAHWSRLWILISGFSEVHIWDLETLRWTCNLLWIKASDKINRYWSEIEKGTVIGKKVLHWSYAKGKYMVFHFFKMQTPKTSQPTSVS